MKGCLCLNKGGGLSLERTCEFSVGNREPREFAPFWDFYPEGNRQLDGFCWGHSNSFPAYQTCQEANMFNHSVRCNYGISWLHMGQHLSICGYRQPWLQLTYLMGSASHVVSPLKLKSKKTQTQHHHAPWKSPPFVESTRLTADLSYSAFPVAAGGLGGGGSP